MRKQHQHLDSECAMKEFVIPCYGGPYDGKFYPLERAPIGYKVFEVTGVVRGKSVTNQLYLWKMMRIKHLDFSIMFKASKIEPEKEDKNGPIDS